MLKMPFESGHSNQQAS
jgi:hypothetical protein